MPDAAAVNVALPPYVTVWFVGFVVTLGDVHETGLTVTCGLGCGCCARSVALNVPDGILVSVANVYGVATPTVGAVTCAYDNANVFPLSHAMVSVTEVGVTVVIDADWHVALSTVT